MEVWKHRTLLVLLVLAGGAIGYVLGRAPATVEDAPPPRAPPPHTGTSPPADEPELARLRRENADLRARIDELERTARPVKGLIETDVPGYRLRIAGRGGDPAVGTLRVAVVDENGQPRSGLRVTVRQFGAKQEEVPESTTGPDGLASFASVPAGRHLIAVFLPQGHRSVTARVVAGEAREATLELPLRGEVLGVVRHAETGPVSGAFLSLFRSDGVGDQVQFRTRTDETGGFRIEYVPPGTYSLRASTPSGSGPSSAASMELVVSDRGPTRKDIVVGVPKLYGTVRDAETGLGISQVSIRVQPGYQEATSGADGSYRFADVRPGKLNLVVSRAGYGIVFLRNVEVSEEGTRLDLELTLAAKVHLRLSDANGEPVVGRVYLGISPVVKGQGTRVGTSVMADASGRATYHQIVPGDYTLNLAVGKAKAELGVQVAPGENTFEARLE